MASSLRFLSYVPSLIRHTRRVQVRELPTTNQLLEMSRRRHLWLNHYWNQDHHEKDQTKQEESTEPVLYLSDTCVKQLLSVAESPDTMLRVTVEGGGCSGFQYKFSLDSNVNKEDKTFEKDGARVVIDDLSLSFLSGSTIDYYQEMIRSSFRVTGNPHMEMGCSCGVSFSLK